MKISAHRGRRLPLLCEPDEFLVCAIQPSNLMSKHRELGARTGNWSIHYETYHWCDVFYASRVPPSLSSASPASSSSRSWNQVAHVARAALPPNSQASHSRNCNFLIRGRSTACNDEYLAIGTWLRWISRLSRRIVFKRNPSQTNITRETEKI